VDSLHHEGGPFRPASWGKIGFYFSRHGVVQTTPYHEVRIHTDYESAVEALFRVAREEFPKDLSERPHRKK
jgi:hypothetical protein